MGSFPWFFRFRIPIETHERGVAANDNLGILKRREVLLPMHLRLEVHHQGPAEFEGSRSQQAQ